MIIEKAIIEEIIEDKKIVVRFIGNGDSEGCASCKSKSLCHVNEKKFDLPFESGHNVGENVLVKMENISILKATSIVYGIPLIALVGGILLGYYVIFKNITNVDLKSVYSFLIGCGFIGLSYFVIKILDKHAGNKINISLHD